MNSVMFGCRRLYVAMHDGTLDAVTGAFGYTGKYIAEHLLREGRRVRTLTGHPDRMSPFAEPVAAIPFNFDRPDALAASLHDVDTLYNTYWIRFPRHAYTFERAVANSRVLISAAKEAGVRRFVHVSITNPSEDSPLGYFRGKALVERALIESGMSYAIIRPTVVFGVEDILINNIAWLLRRLPVFGVPGSGDYKLQPVFAADLAKLAVEAATRSGNAVTDAVGPEVFTFRELVQRIADAVRSRAAILPMNPSTVLGLARVFGWLLGDVVLTREEVAGLSAGLLVSKGPPTCPTRFTQWLATHGDRLGQDYASELARHYGRR